MPSAGGKAISVRVSGLGAWRPPVRLTRSPEMPQPFSGGPLSRRSAPASFEARIQQTRLMSKHRRM